MPKIALFLLKNRKIAERWGVPAFSSPLASDGPGCS